MSEILFTEELITIYLAGFFGMIWLLWIQR
jgi:hypothetical protein